MLLIFLCYKYIVVGDPHRPMFAIDILKSFHQQWDLTKVNQLLLYLQY